MCKGCCDLLSKLNSSRRAIPEVRRKPVRAPTRGPSGAHFLVLPFAELFHSRPEGLRHPQALGCAGLNCAKTLAKSRNCCKHNRRAIMRTPSLRHIDTIALVLRCIGIIQNTHIGAAGREPARDGVATKLYVAQWKPIASIQHRHRKKNAITPHYHTLSHYVFCRTRRVTVAVYLTIVCATLHSFRKGG